MAQSNNLRPRKTAVPKPKTLDADKLAKRKEAGQASVKAAKLKAGWTEVDGKLTPPKNRVSKVGGKVAQKANKSGSLKSQVASNMANAAQRKAAMDNRVKSGNTAAAKNLGSSTMPSPLSNKNAFKKMKGNDNAL